MSRSKQNPTHEPGRAAARMPGQGIGDAPGESGPRSLLGDVSGAFADLGTFLPLMIGVFAVQRAVDPAGLLVGFGAFALFTALVYRRPIPVQPMKAVAALAIAGGLGSAGIAAAGMLLGIVLLVLGGLGLVGRLGRVIPTNVMLGVQFGVGLYLAWAGLKLMAGAPWLAATALLLLLALQATRFKPLGALAVVVGAAAWGAMQAGPAGTALAWGLNLPAFALPDLTAWWESSRDVLLPQLALTLTNATVITAAIASDYFPRDRDRITPDRLALSTGAANLLLAPFGAFPMCHGAGGLVVQHRFGARTGLAPALFGSTCLLLGLFLGAQAMDLLALLPLAAVGSLLLIAGFDLSSNRKMRHASPDAWAVIGLSGLACVVANVLVGLLLGLALEWLRRRYVVGGEPG